MGHRKSVKRGMRKFCQWRGLGKGMGWELLINARGVYVFVVEGGSQVISSCLAERRKMITRRFFNLIPNKQIPVVGDRPLPSRGGGDYTLALAGSARESPPSNN